jgi:phosphatidylserine/phosphatidylglycerophosphate/cardiolipin synthase-like enzyme
MRSRVFQPLAFLPLGLGLALGAFLAALPRAAANGEPEAAVAYFAPGGNIEPAVAKLIGEARQEIEIAMYLFTSKPLADAVIRAKARGVNIRLILDGDQKPVRHGKYAELKKAGVPMRIMELGKTGEHQDIRFHHKFLIVDRQVVETGSFNWTQQADEENWENAVIVRSKALAAQFHEQFEKAWAAAKPDDARAKSE